MLVYVMFVKHFGKTECETFRSTYYWRLTAFHMKTTITRVTKQHILLKYSTQTRNKVGISFHNVICSLKIVEICKKD